MTERNDGNWIEWNERIMTERKWYERMIANGMYSEWNAFDRANEMSV